MRIDCIARTLLQAGMAIGTGMAIALTFPTRAETDVYAPFHNLLNTGSCIKCDFENANLQGADLSYTDLQDTNLRGAKLYRGGPQHANLEGANLEAADLHLADLRMANLRGANLEGANLSMANLHGSDLRGANLEGADLRGANLDRAQLFADNSDASPLASLSPESASDPTTAALATRGTVVVAGDILSLLVEANRNSETLAVQLEGALFDRRTQFPEGFDPAQAGMTFMP